MSWKWLVWAIYLAVLVRAVVVDHVSEDPKSGKDYSVVKTWTVTSEITKDSITMELSKGYMDRYDVVIDYHRSSCEAEVLQRFSEDNSTETMAKMFSGPDEMVLQIEGKELLAFVPRYIACGKYHSGFHLLLSGAYHFKLARMRSNFSALNELDLTYPMIKLEYLVSDWVELAGSRGKSSHCHHSHYGAWILKSLLPLDAHHSSSVPSVFDSIKTAEAIAPIEYKNGDDRSVPIKSFVPLGSDHAEKGCLKNYDLYSYEPVTGCKWSHINANEAAAIMSHKKLAIAGDSHMRIFGNLLMKWACGVEMPFKKGQYTHVQLKNDTSERCPGLSISYSANYYCSAQAFTWHPWKIEDFILLNCGHHSAAEEHQPVQVYKETMVTFAKHANGSNSGITRKNFMWIESNPQPLRNDGFVIGSRDWRTEHRLTLFNLISNGVFLRNHYEVLYAFETLLPFYDSGCDYAHYSGDGPLYPIFNQFLSVLRDKSR